MLRSSCWSSLAIPWFSSFPLYSSVSSLAVFLCTKSGTHTLTLSIATYFSLSCHSFQVQGSVLSADSLIWYTVNLHGYPHHSQQSLWVLKSNQIKGYIMPIHNITNLHSWLYSFGELLLFNSSDDHLRLVGARLAFGRSCDQRKKWSEEPVAIMCLWIVSAQRVREI